MPKILFLSDTHLGQDYPIRKTSKPKRGHDFFDNFEKVLDYAINQKVDLVLHGGDLFFRAKIPEQIVQKVYKIIYEFSKHKIPILILPGNHERSRFPRSPLINQDFIHIFSYPKTYNFEVKGIKIGISGFPYHRDNIRDNFPQIFKELKSEFESADLRLLMTHHAVEGCTCGPGNFTFRHNEDVIQMEDIPHEFDAVLCGHIHRQQVLHKSFEYKTTPILYCGSTEKTSFAEIDETKGFYEMSINNEYGKLKLDYSFIPLPSRPMINIEILESFKNTEDALKMILSELENYPKGSLVRLKFKNPEIIKNIKIAEISKVLENDYFLQISGLNIFKPKTKKKERLKTLFD